MKEKSAIARRERYQNFPLSSLRVKLWRFKRLRLAEDSGRYNKTTQILEERCRTSSYIQVYYFF